jgi:GAF domain-containing protein
MTGLATTAHDQDPSISRPAPELGWFYPQRLRRLRVYNALIHGAETLDLALEHALQAMAELTEAKRALIMLVDDEGTCLRGRRGLGVLPDVVEQIGVPLATPTGDPPGIHGYAVQMHEPTLIRGDDPRLEPPIGALWGPRGHLLVMPLIGRSSVLGTITTTWEHDAPVAPEALEPPLILADHVAMAIDAHRQLAVERQQRLVAEELHTMAQRITAGLSLDDVLAAILRAVERLLGASSASIFLAQQGDLVADRRFTTRNTGEPHWDDHTRVRPDGLTSTVLKTGEPIIVEDATNDPRVSDNSRTRSRSFAVVPIRYGDRSVGVLYVNWRDPRKPRPGDLRLLETLAAYGAIAIDNANRHAGEVETARVDGVLLAARTVAHEINNDLALTMGMAEIAQMQAQAGHLPDPAILDDVIQGAQRIAKHIRQLQSVVRLEERHVRDLPPLLDLGHSSDRPDRS